MLLLLVPGWAQAGEQVAGYDVEVAAYKDLRQDLTIDTASGVSFSPVSGRFGLGFDAPVTWVRLTLRPNDRAVDLAQPLMLRLGPHALDKVDFYQRVDGRWVVEHVGDLRPRIKTPCIDDLYCFAVNPRDQDETVFYLRIQTTGFPFITAHFVPPTDLLAVVVKRTYYLTGALVAGVVLLVVGLMLLVLERTALLKIYCSHQVIVTCLFLLGTGAISVAESNLELLDWATVLVLNFRNASLSLVFWLVLAPYRPSLSYRRLFIGLMVAYGSGLLALLAGQIHLSMQINFVMQAVAAIVLVQGLITAGQLPRLLRNTLLIGAGLYIVLLVAGYRVVLGFTPGGTVDFGLLDWRLNGTPIGIFAVWILLIEHKLRNLARADAYLAIEKSQDRLRADAERHSERGAMIDMLTHELKTPLSTIRFALASASRLFQKQGGASDTDRQNFMLRAGHIESSVSRMDAMILQVAQAHKVEHMVVSAVPEEMALQSLFEDLVRPYALTHHVELDIEPDLLLRSDRLMLTTLVENLISNACKYSLDQWVSLSVRRDKPAQGAAVVRIAVANRVAADTEPDEARLFERYYRHSAVSDQPGTGMGLHIARSAASKIGATLRYSIADNVVNFEVSVPC
jgi:signal transduction histidine kinase